MLLIAPISVAVSVIVSVYITLKASRKVEAVYYYYNWNSQNQCFRLKDH